MKTIIFFGRGGGEVEGSGVGAHSLTKRGFTARSR